MTVDTIFAYLLAIIATGVAGGVVTSIVSAWYNAQINRQLKDSVVTAVNASSNMLTTASANMQGVVTGAVESMQNSFTEYVNALLLIHGSSELPRAMRSVKTQDTHEQAQTQGK